MQSIVNLSYNNIDYILRDQIMEKFTHLQVYSEYTLLSSSIKIKKLVDNTIKLGMDAVALTDRGVMYGAIEFYEACKRSNIKPIFGCEVTVASESEPVQLVLLAENNRGYHNLIKLSSLMQLSSSLTLNLLDLVKHKEGLIAILLPPQSQKIIAKYLQIFGSTNLFLSIQDQNLHGQKIINTELIDLAAGLNVSLVATNSVHYLLPEDSWVQDCLSAIASGHTIAEESRPKLLGNHYYLKSPKEMAILFEHIPEAISNTKTIASRCNVTLDMNKKVLPKFHADSSITSKELLYSKCMDGLTRRYEPGNPQVLERLNYELSIIDRMGYNDYFLIVWDIVNYAKTNNIAVGPGRGSATGSIVSYLLGITDIDPIKYDLLFERFLNPERLSLPDIDIDFDYERREEVIKYVSQKHGYHCVAQIITFGTFSLRSAIRDVGRALGITYKDVDPIARSITSKSLSLEEALLESPSLKAFLENPLYKELLTLSSKISGLIRNASKHAAGIIIAPTNLSDYIPVKKGDNLLLSQYPMKALEKVGLVKFDLLGLRTLGLINSTLEMFEKDNNFNWEIDDPKTYSLLCQGETAGIFQVESAGMRRVLKKLQPTTFEDIIAVGALYRPGPMEQISAFIQAKNGLIKPDYIHPDLEPILENTYGNIVYQEQIMLIACKIAGFSMGSADLLRRAISKKDEQLLIDQHKTFIEGCLNNGYSTELAEKVFDLILRFANYGFPRSHAAAYGLLTYQTAYLKANYPIYFFTALLNSIINDVDKVRMYTEEACRNNIDFLRQDVQFSQKLFTVENEKIRCGLQMIPNIGPRVIEHILERRQTCPFIDFNDFLERTDKRICNKLAITALLTSGALDSLEPIDRERKIEMLIPGSESNKNIDSVKTIMTNTSAYIKVSPEYENASTLSKLQKILTKHPGDVPVYLYYNKNNQLRLLTNCKIKPTSDCINEIEDILGCPSFFLKQD